MTTLIVSLGIGIANAKQEEEVEIDDDEWNSCQSDEDREKVIDQYALDWAWGYIDIGAEVKK